MCHTEQKMTITAIKGRAYRPLGWSEGTLDTSKNVTTLKQEGKQGHYETTNELLQERLEEPHDGPQNNANTHLYKGFVTVFLGP